MASPDGCSALLGRRIYESKVSVLGYLVLRYVLVWVGGRRSLIQGELAKIIGLVIAASILYMVIACQLRLSGRHTGREFMHHIALDIRRSC